jgi:ATP-dependent Clp protease ATP-binding subunit ClpC
MLIAGLLTLSLLSIGATLFALARLRSSERRREQLEREQTDLRGQLETERQKSAQAALSAEAQAAKPAEAERAAKAEAVGDTKAHTGDEQSGDGQSEAAKDESRMVEPAATADDSSGGSGAAEETTTETSTDVYALAWGMDDFFNATAHPRELLLNETFLKVVESMRGAEYTADELFDFGRGTNACVACMALEALARRDDGERPAERLIYNANDIYHWPRFFALRALDAHVRRPVLAELLARLDSSWRDYIPLQVLRDFVARRVEAGEVVTFDVLLAEINSLNLDAERIADINLTVQGLGEALPSALREEFARQQDERAAVEFLKTLGRVWEARGEAVGEVFVLDTVAGRVAELKASLKRKPPRSVLLVGDSGVGKTALLRALAESLRAEHWIVFEAGAADVLAGQQYIGQLEERVQSIVRQIEGRRVLWVVPNFHEMLWAGRHKYSPVGVLDLLLPSVESGAVKVIGEMPSDAYEQLMRLRPRLRTAMQTCRVSPLGDEETLELGRRWAARRATLVVPSGSQPALDAPDSKPRVSEQTLREAFQLAKQYLGDKAAPGNLLLFLDATDRRLSAEEKGTSGEITLDDLLVTLSHLTGLPASILDEREGLDLNELRAFFERRVLGQPEAVDCLVERVAMVKAGLTDPTRPQGVFLFVGPTGTGKTEIAKTLAEFLFGSPERMIRLDMSELQTWESQARILGEADETSESAALVNLIRKQPFSVVLLDEFEKAHPAVWDLFLQVFDDGRLTDRRGNTADFRHCVVIMTSNLGATLPHGASIGFSQEQAQFASASVERAVGRAFRREFVNRIDRVVVFRPLGRAVMRDLLRKELNDVLTRRGLRTRQWAVEWDESAIEFLLGQGFTADLGARPLKRAVERYLLSPLALSIVNHQFPEGDQFLFVRSSADGQALDVQFVDPDEPEPKEPELQAVLDEEEVSSTAAARELRPESIALDPHGTPEEVRFLREKFDEVAARVGDETWTRRKEDALRQMQTADFWTSPGRFSVLGLAEYMDRIEAGLDTAGSLLARLHGGRKRLPPELLRRLAEQLYLLDAACRGLAAGEPRDAFLLVRACREAGTDGDGSDRFARRLVRMYRRWAEKRRMRAELIEEQDGARDEGGSASEYRALLAVSGYAAYTILRPESGLHVLETPQDEKSFNRARALVRVAAQPDEPAGHDRGALPRQAEHALAADADATPPQVVRRYREEPSPLVRDSARGWRTGKLERVLEGDFDLIT